MEFKTYTKEEIEKFGNDNFVDADMIKSLSEFIKAQECYIELNELNQDEAELKVTLKLRS